MKKIILILLFSLTLFANTDSCKLDVYFGNGVWNNAEQAEESMEELKTFMQMNNIMRFLKVDDGKTYEFLIAHNAPHGYIDDMIETYWQLYTSGQITNGYFTSMTAALNRADGSISTYMQRINNIIATYNLHVSTMIKGYREESLNLKHNVLLVAHSQGNLFGNQMYDLLTAEEKDRFKMVSVATPANNVTGDYSLSAPYTTIVADYTIALIKNSFPGNASGFGHTFVDSYLHSHITPTRVKINSDIINAVNLLDKNICKKEYDYYRFISYICPTHEAQELVVDIYATHINEDKNTPTSEEYIASDVRVLIYDDFAQHPVTISSTTGSNGSGSMIIPDTDSNGWLTEACPIQIQNDDFITSVPKYNKDGCSAYTFTDTSEDTLDFVSNNTYSSVFTCSSYNMSSDTQSLLESSSK